MTAPSSPAASRSRRILGRVEDAGLLVLLVLAVPLVILVVGAPLALVIKAVTALLHRF